MIFFETSAKTHFNIDEVLFLFIQIFSISANEIGKKINENYYDLTDEVK